jgi:hypothetical protein
MLRGLVILTLCLVFIGGSVGVNAEVSVRTDRAGKYVTTQILTTSAQGLGQKIWSPRGRTARQELMLNPFGDVNGDLWPTIAETPRAPYQPWVVWSRFNGREYDLAWSAWTPEGWSSISWVARGNTAGDDLDPEAAFDRTGRLFVVWWRASAEGPARVYMSAFLVRRWSIPILVSDPIVDSRHPVITRSRDGMLWVRYETPNGTERRGLGLNRPDTITDDINPQISSPTGVTPILHKSRQR